MAALCTRTSVAAAVLAFAANVLVVLMYWASTGKFGGFMVLAKQGAIWATVRFDVALLVYASILGLTQGVLYYRRTQTRELQLAKIEGQLAQASRESLSRARPARSRPWSEASPIARAWTRPRKRGVYQVFTLSWDFSFHSPNGATPVCINL